ncbi:MAG TPA: hypothetical protein VFN57_20100 [Thermomicrobiaceae bacterium]|nr:hypothetical protein [Thermomicrobiaceae bacterium]
MRGPATELPSGPSLSSPDGADLRAALRLLLDETSVDRLVASAGDVRDLLGRVATRYTLERGWARIRRRAPGAGAPPLNPRAGLTARGATLLALQVGAGWGSASLGTLAGLDPEEVGGTLTAARVRLAGPDAQPCVAGAALAGRYRDPDLRPDERAELLTHAARCRSCQQALARFAEVDAGLTAAVAAARTTMPPAPPRPARLRRAVAGPSPRLLALTGLMLVLVAGLVAGRGLLSGTRAVPLPLLAPGGPARPALPGGGLLYERSDGGLAALDTSTGARTVLAPPRGAGTFTPRQAYALSPNHALLASVSPSFDASGLAPSVTLTVSRVDGDVVYQHTWLQDAATSVSFDGWLCNASVLVTFGGATGPRLTAVDVTTRRSRVLYTGDLGTIVASPDGSRIAIATPRSPGWLGGDLEVRPVEPDGLGPATTVVTHRITGLETPVWSPDGRRLYFGLIADAGAAILGPGANSSPDQAQPSEIVLAALDPGGTVIRLSDAVPQRYDLPLTVSPDGARLLYEREVVAGTGPATRSLHAVGTDGSDDRDVLPSVTAVAGVGWLPGGRSAIALADQPYPLATGPAEQSLGPVTLPTLYLVDASGTAQPVRALPDANATSGIVQWFPAGTLPSATGAPPAVPAGGRLGAPAPVPGLGAAAVAPGSAASDDGRYVLLQDQQNHTPVVWAAPPEGPRPLDGVRVSQAAWVPGEHLAVGVLAVGPGQAPQPSRLTLLSMPPGSGPLANADLRGLDPAAVGSDPHRHYLLPRVSPDGLSVAFEVSDDRSGLVTLWLATVGARPRPVAGWQASASVPVDGVPSPLAWASNDTLVFTEPADRQAGLPQAVTLERLTLAPDGTTAVTRLRTFDARGNDSAIVAADLAVSPDGRNLAVRLRHFGPVSAAVTTTDSVEVLPAADLSQSIELARGSAGNGLAWSPGGDRLAYALDGRVTVASADGRTLATIDAGPGRSDAPCWVGPTEVWFAYQPPDPGLPVRTLMVAVH